jgi:hypothetical protein
VSLALFTFGTRLRATADRRALLCGSANRVAIRPDALAISVVAMSGEHSGTWGLAVGPLNASKPQKFHCADPSMFTLQVDMWDKVERYVTAHIDRSLEAGVAPQIVVANNKCWEVLAETAGRLSTADRSVKAMTLAHWVLYANERAALAGDPTVVRMADLLSSVYVCGGEPTHDANLQSVMAWIDGGDDLDERLEAALLDNECFLDPEREDAEFATPFLKMKALQLKAIREEGVDVRVKNAGSYTHKLNGILDRRWRRIREAVDLYRGAGLADIPETAAFADLAFRAWTREHDYRAAHPFAVDLSDGEARRAPKGRYDSAREGNAKLAERSAYADQWNHTLVWRDRYERMKAFADGRLVDGVVATVDDDGTVHVAVPHNMLRVRVGDELVPFDRPKDRAVVTFLDQQADGSTVVGVVDHSAPPTGEGVCYGPRPPAPFDITSGAIRRNRGLKAAGWTHYISEPAPPRLPTETPANILQKVNDARATR